MDSFFNLVYQNPIFLLFPMPFVVGGTVVLAAWDLKRTQGEHLSTLNVINHRYWRRVMYVMYPVGAMGIFGEAIRAAQQGFWFATCVNGAFAAMFMWAAIVEYYRRYKIYRENHSERK